MQVESLLEKEDNIEKESNIEEKYDDVDEPLKKKAKSTSSHIEQLSKKKVKKYQFNVK